MEVTEGVQVEVGVGVGDTVNVWVTVRVLVGLAVGVGDTVHVCVIVLVPVNAGVIVGEKVNVEVTVRVAVKVGVAVGDTVNVGVMVEVPVAVGVAVGEMVKVGLRVNVCVMDGVGLLVDVTVIVRVRVAVDVNVKVAAWAEPAVSAAMKKTSFKSPSSLATKSVSVFPQVRGGQATLDRLFHYAESHTALQLSREMAQHGRHVPVSARFLYQGFQRRNFEGHASSLIQMKVQNKRPGQPAQHHPKGETNNVRQHQ